MKKFILGKKIGMTQIFGEEGISIPVTVIEAGPCKVIQKKTMENEGYNAVKLGFAAVSTKDINKPDKGQFSKIKAEPMKYLKEFRADNVDEFEAGQEIKVSSMFEPGDHVDISGVSKGKGFQGTTKRFGTRIGRMTHGSKYHRRVGSMGAGTSPGRVYKGKKLPGHMGSVNVTVQNLDVVKVDDDKNLLVIKGSVPGAKGSLLVIKETVKG